ncbi:sulfatase [Tautonia plasticadhaerens]|uniref:Choline-sulfatase n=1 Tax=Tautonia plasticadhaerens TaxID=2527974 RepID=A0A518HEF5_9BACT|nr:sulfatase [Tautonia plasticadhaerens]QDV39146.1 Choline-sulfatase [Tautonia plasticadhaerens]
MQRSKIWGLAAPLAIVAAGLGPGDHAEASAPQERPNVLFIAVEDLNDWTGFLGGHPQARTPNLDRLAARGVSFTRAYCSAPACNPSRTSLLTGLRPSTTGVYHNDQPWRPVLPDAVTLTDHFAAAGYDVAGGGKIFHNSFNDPDAWPEWFKAGDHPEPDETPVNGIPGAGHFDWGPVDVPDEAMGDHRTVSWAIDRLDDDRDRRFFLAVGLIRPHLQWYVPRGYFEHYPVDGISLPEAPADDLDDVPAAGVAIARPDGDHRKVLEAGQWEEAVQGYLASIEFADAQVGRLLDALEASGLADETIVVLWGDHGWHLGEKQHWRKFALWEEATRVPLIIAAPGVAAHGGRSGRPVSLMDLYPTLVELCGLPQKPELEGESLVPLLRDPASPRATPAITTHGRANHAVRTERWRYIRYADGSEELYDHEADPQEWTNLADDPRWEGQKRDLGRWLPPSDAPYAPRRRDDGRRDGIRSRPDAPGSGGAGRR